MPSGSPVGGLIECGPRAVIGSASRPRRATGCPQHAVNCLRVPRIKCQIDGADIAVLVEHLLPCRSSIKRTENPPFIIRPVRMSHRSDEDVIGVVWIDENSANLLSITQAKVLPGLAAIT